ncbi:MAG: response regulator [Acidobacteriota bacterium]|jgi:DNA-binding response OmpR family regulator|nr:response regulator [Acidobacteriota bacterium]
MPEILLIDDDATQLCVRAAVLVQAGFSVFTASTAAEAQEKLQQTEVSAALRLIITDHMMPGASGSVFVRELRRLSPHVPVIVISGLSEAEEEYAGLNVTFLNKPSEPEELIARVRALVQGNI